MYLKGEIRHPKQFPKAIVKCIGPIDSEIRISTGEVFPTESFILTKNFPKPHYLAIDRLIDNFFFSESKIYIVHLITHSDDYNNMKIKSEHFQSCRLNLTQSYITRNAFLIEEKYIDGTRIFGTFNMELLYKDFLIF